MRKKILSLILCIGLLMTPLVGCTGGGQSTASSSTPPALASSASAATDSSGGEVTIEFAQWWEPELPDGSFQKIVDRFEAENPGIKVKLLSNPFAAAREQMIAGIAAGTLSDIVGLSGTFVRDFASQGAITDLGALMTQAGFDRNVLASSWEMDGTTYMVPIVTFIYPMFVNNDLLAQAGIGSLPSNRSEFKEAARAISTLDPNVSGWVLPLALDAPNGIQNDLMVWLWASGDSMLKDGKPNVAGNQDMKELIEFIKELYDENLLSPGAFALKEQDKVEEFRNGRVGMMISSMAHINTIRDGSPDLNFSVIPVPAKDGYTGQRGTLFGPWGAGISETSANKAEAWKFLEYLLSEEVNAEMATLANGFPGNANATPDFVKGDELFSAAFTIYQENYLCSEFFGLPVVTELQRRFDEQLQLMLEGDQDIDTMLVKIQEAWEAEF